jgi:hypothetical protein
MDAGDLHLAPKQTPRKRPNKTSECQKRKAIHLCLHAFLLFNLVGSCIECRGVGVL